MRDQLIAQKKYWITKKYSLTYADNKYTYNLDTPTCSGIAISKEQEMFFFINELCNLI
jgi:hypothetical protein